MDIQEFNRRILQSRQYSLPGGIKVYEQQYAATVTDDGRSEQ